VKLQKIDIESGKLKSFLMEVPKRLSTIDQSLDEYVRGVEDQETIIKELNKKYRTYEADAQMTLNKIEKSQKKLHSVKTNKEYQSSLKEIEDLEVIPADTLVIENAAVDDDVAAPGGVGAGEYIGRATVRAIVVITIRIKNGKRSCRQRAWRELGLPKYS